MLADFWGGLATGLALIVAIGSQNAFVLRNGILRSHVLPIVAFCALSDALLIVAGIAGAGALVRGNTTLMLLTRYGGAIFLAWYALLAARRAWQSSHLQLTQEGVMPLGTALAACFGFTFLNPHVYLDTVILVGSLAAPYSGSARLAYTLGAVAASFSWFFALGYGARILTPLFAKPVAWRILDAIIALVMVSIAGKLMLWLLSR